MNFISFMFFSTIEGLSIYATALYLFRYNFKRFIWHSLIIIELINLQNFLTREEIPSMSYIAPITNLLITALFFKTIARIPMIGSLTMAIAGIFVSGLVQAAVIFGLFGSVQEMSADPIKGYIAQLLTGVIITSISWLLYSKGKGFSFDWEKVKFKWEHVVVIIAIIAFVIMLGVMMYSLNVITSLFGFLVSLLILLFYALRKEAGEEV